MKTSWQVAINRMEFHRRFSPKGSLFTLLEGGEEGEESRYRKYKIPRKTWLVER